MGRSKGRKLSSEAIESLKEKNRESNKRWRDNVHQDVDKAAHRKQKRHEQYMRWKERQKLVHVQESEEEKERRREKERLRRQEQRRGRKYVESEAEKERRREKERLRKQEQRRGRKYVICGTAMGNDDVGVPKKKIFSEEIPDQQTVLNVPVDVEAYSSEYIIILPNDEPSAESDYQSFPVDAVCASPFTSQFNIGNAVDCAVDRHNPGGLILVNSKARDSLNLVDQQVDKQDTDTRQFNDPLIDTAKSQEINENCCYNMTINKSGAERKEITPECRVHMSTQTSHFTVTSCENGVDNSLKSQTVFPLSSHKASEAFVKNITRNPSISSQNRPGLKVAREYRKKLRNKISRMRIALEEITRLKEKYRGKWKTAELRYFTAACFLSNGKLASGSVPSIGSNTKSSSAQSDTNHGGGITLKGLLRCDNPHQQTPLTCNTSVRMPGMHNALVPEEITQCYAIKEEYIIKDENIDNGAFSEVEDQAREDSFGTSYSFNDPFNIVIADSNDVKLFHKPGKVAQEIHPTNVNSIDGISLKDKFSSDTRHPIVPVECCTSLQMPTDCKEENLAIGTTIINSIIKEEYMIEDECLGSSDLERDEEYNLNDKERISVVDNDPLDCSNVTNNREVIYVPVDVTDIVGTKSITLKNLLECHDSHAEDPLTSNISTESPVSIENAVKSSNITEDLILDQTIKEEFDEKDVVVKSELTIEENSSKSWTVDVQTIPEPIGVACQVDHCDRNWSKSITHKDLLKNGNPQIQTPVIFNTSIRIPTNVEKKIQNLAVNERCFQNATMSESSMIPILSVALNEAESSMDILKDPNIEHDPLGDIEMESNSSGFEPGLLSQDVDSSGTSDNEDEIAPNKKQFEKLKKKRVQDLTPKDFLCPVKAERYLSLFKKSVKTIRRNLNSERKKCYRLEAKKKALMDTIGDLQKENDSLRKRPP